MVNSFNIKSISCETKVVYLKERGSILISVVLFIVLAIGLAAFAIDTGLLLNAKEQVKDFTSLATLAATEEYYATTCGVETVETCHSVRMSNIAQRVNALSAYNNVIMQQGTNPSATIEDSQQQALIEPGLWSNAGNFTPLEYSGPFPGFPTAFRISGKFYPPIQLTLAKAFLGSKELPVSESAIAHYPAKKFVILVDMSRSLTRDTHQIDTISPTNQSYPDSVYEYAYFYSYGGTAASCPLYPSPTYEYIEQCATSGVEVNRYYSMNFDPQKTRDPVTSSPLQYYFNDYRFTMSTFASENLLWDADYDTGSINIEGQFYNFSDLMPDPTIDSKYTTKRQGYKLQNYRSNDFTGAEPLTSVLEGVSSATAQIENRNNKDDGVAVVFFGHRLEWPRIFKMGRNFKFIQDITDVRVTSSGQEGAAVANEIRNAHRLHLFPKKPLTADAELNPGSTPADPTGHNYETNGSNIKLALQEALNQLGPSAGSIPGQDQIILITDGFHNCKTPSGPQPTDCMPTIEYVREAWQELDQFVTDTLLPLKIPVHVIGIGDNFDPNYREFRLGVDARCATDKEIRASGNTLSYVVGDKFNGSTAGNWDLYYEGNPYTPSLPMGSEINTYLYNLAYRTRGLYRPILKRNQACGSALEVTARDCSDLPIFDPNDVAGTSRVIREDPFCRSKEQQLIDILEEIIPHKDISLVQ
jgi:hypothetical protein